MNDKRSTGLLLKVFMPAILVVLPVIVFSYLYSFYKSHDSQLTWAEVLLVPSSVFLIIVSVCVFFITIWWYRNSIGQTK